MREASDIKWAVLLRMDVRDREETCREHVPGQSMLAEHGVFLGHIKVDFM